MCEKVVRLHLRVFDTLLPVFRLVFTLGEVHMKVHSHIVLQVQQGHFGSVDLLKVIIHHLQPAFSKVRSKDEKEHLQHCIDGIDSMDRSRPLLITPFKCHIRLNEVSFTNELLFVFSMSNIYMLLYYYFTTI